MTARHFDHSKLFCAVFLGAVVFSFAIDARAELSASQNGGPIIIRNGRTPDLQNGRSPVVRLKNDLILGQDQDDPNSSFSSVNYFAVDGRGNIFVVDPKEYRIKLFSPLGKFLKTFGQRGQGPGEFQTPSMIRSAPDGNLFIHDFLSRRLHYFTSEGKWLRTISFPELDLGEFQVGSNGFFYGISVTRDEKSTKFDLIKLDAGLRPIRSLATVEWPRNFKMVAFGLPSLYFDVNRRDEVVWAKSGEYMIHVMDAKGELVRKIHRESPPLEVTPGAKDRFLKNIEELDKKSPIRFPKHTWEFPKFYPPIQYLFVDDQDRIYVRTFETSEHGEILYDIFGEGGKFISRFSLPEKEEAMVVKKDRLYTIIRGYSFGEYAVKRYVMNWE